MLSVRIVKAVQETTKDGPRRRIQVTALPQKVNTPTLVPRKHAQSRGQILSVEDHGFLVDLGWQRRGFCKFQDIKGPYRLVEDKENAMETDNNHDGETDTTRILGVGRILDFVVTGMDAQVTSLELLTPEQLKKKVTLTTLPPLEDLARVSLS